MNSTLAQSPNLPLDFQSIISGCEIFGSDLIDISNLSSLDRKVIQRRIAANYPVFQMQREFEIGSFFSGIAFGGVKQINDSIGQSKVDSLLVRFKEEVLDVQGIDIAVWDDYKNFFLKIDNTSLTHDIDLDDIMNNSGESLQLRSGINLPEPISERGRIESYGDLNKSIKLSVLKFRMRLEQLLSQNTTGYLDFYREKLGDSQSYVENFLVNDERISTEKAGDKNLYTISGKKLFITEGSSDIYPEIENGRLTNSEDFSYTASFDFFVNGKVNPKLKEYYFSGSISHNTEIHDILSRSIYCTEVSSVLEEEVQEANRMYGVEKTEGGNAYLIITHPNGSKERTMLFGDNGFYNDTIITWVRKKKIPTSLGLYIKIRTILDMLVIDGEAIYPDWGEEYSSISMNEYSEIQNAFENGEKVDKDLFERAYNGYYKGGLSKEAFVESLAEKEGQLFFIDIKDMGTENMLDIQNMLEKVLDPNDATTQDEAIEKSGGIMTEKFKSIISNLQKELDGRSYSYTIGGDEIKIFIEERNLGLNKIIKSLHHIISQQDIFGRIVTSQKLASDNGAELIEKLDTSTSLSKKLEDVYSVIDRRLNSQRRELGEEFSNISLLFQLFSMNILSKEEIGKFGIKAGYNLLMQKIEKSMNILGNLHSFYIEVPTTGEEKDFIIHLNKKDSYRVDDIFDLDTMQLIPNTAFTKKLDGLELSRKKH